MIIDRKITDDMIAQIGVVSAPDTLTGNPEDNKRIFDNLATGVAKEGVNGLIDELLSPAAAEQLGASVSGYDSPTIGGVLQLIQGDVSGRVEKVEGKGLSTKDFTSAEKLKLADIEPLANRYVLPAATSSILGGVKQGIGVEVLADGTINGLSAPAPDLVARAQIEDHANDKTIHVGHMEGVTLVGWEPISFEADGLTVMTEVPAVVTAKSRVDIISVPPSYVAEGYPQLWPVNVAGTCYICATEAPPVDVPITISVQEVEAESPIYGLPSPGGAGGGGPLSTKVTITVVGSLPAGVGGTKVVVRNERLGLYLTLPLDANHRAKFEVLSGLKYHVYLTDYPEGYYGGDVTIFTADSEDVEETIDMLTTPDIVGFYVNQTAKTVTYTDGCIGWASAKMDTGGWTWGDWLNHWLVTECRPCLLKNGVVQYYLNPDDYTKKLDGSAADITSGMDGDVMMEFPRCYVKITTDTTGYFIRFSRTRIDETWTANAFLNREGIPMPYMYMACYDGAEMDGKLRSLSGLAPTVNKTIAQFRALANANGLGYEQQEWLKRSYVQMLFLLLTKATDSQGVVGQGVTSNTNSAAIPSGAMNNKGLCWGDQGGVNGAKFLGIENLWGNTYKFCDGFINVTGTAHIKLYAPYNDAATGYANEGAIPTTTNYIDKIAPTPSKGMAPSSLIADEPTSLYRDRMYTTSTGTAICYTGGNWTNGAYAGLFYIHVNNAATYSYASLSASLSFTPQ